MILPRQDEQGQSYISYSQITAWNAPKGYNTGKPGKEEFIRSYFLGEKFEQDKGGFASFGEHVENYITKREDGDKFTADEKAILETITPLGLFQREIRIEFEGFYLKGYIDDISPDLTHIRDYKTASLNSAKKYYEDDYQQLDVYSLAILKETGKIPTSLEVVVIERKGNGYKGGRDVLKVGGQIWVIPRQTNAAKLDLLSTNIINTAKEISEYYEIFLKLNGNAA